MGLELNINRTKIIDKANDNNFEVDSDRIEVIKHLIFLGSFINKEATSSDKTLHITQ